MTNSRPPEGAVRRRRQRQMLDNTVPSPCLGQCALHPVSSRCTGCLRRAEHVREWMIMTREQKLAVLDDIAAARALPDPHQPQQE